MRYEDLPWPTLKALVDHGGSASIQELSEQIASDLDLSDEILDVPDGDQQPGNPLRPGPVPGSARRGRRRTRPRNRRRPPAPGSCPAVARLRADLVSCATSNTPPGQIDVRTTELKEQLDSMKQDIREGVDALTEAMAELASGSVGLVGDGLSRGAPHTGSTAHPPRRARSASPSSPRLSVIATIEPFQDRPNRATS